MRLTKELEESLTSRVRQREQRKDIHSLYCIVCMYPTPATHNLTCSIKCRNIHSSVWNKMHGIKRPSRKGVKWSDEQKKAHSALMLSRENCMKRPDVIKRSQETKKQTYDLRGRKSSVRNRIKRSKEYATWRKQIFERDNYTCVMCNIRGGELQADHIIPMSIIMREHNITGYHDSLDCTLLWDITNGRTLCRECHMKTDTFGVGSIKLLKELGYSL